jgi:hypothetical protein
MAHCAGCGAPLPPKTYRGNPRKWCSEACRMWAHNHPGGGARPTGTTKGQPRILPDAICQRCAHPFRPKHRDARYCGSECARMGMSEHFVASRPTECIEPGCSNPLSTTARQFRSRCNPCRVRRWPPKPETAKAAQRRKTHMRRAKTRYADFTPIQERAMRAKAKRCPLCRVRLIDMPYLPDSKELDHIVPLGVGGTHTLGNVRIICRACNIRRPRDGSDYQGPVTLWAQDPSVAPTRQVVRPRCPCGQPLKGGRCHTCHPVTRRVPKPRPEPPQPRPCMDCGTLITPTGWKGRPRKYCEACRPAPRSLSRAVTESAGKS